MGFVPLAALLEQRVVGLQRVVVLPRPKLLGISAPSTLLQELAVWNLLWLLWLPSDFLEAFEVVAEAKAMHFERAMLLLAMGSETNSTRRLGYQLVVLPSFL